MTRQASRNWMAGYGSRLVAGAALAALPVVAGVLAGPREAVAQVQEARGTGDDDPPGLDCLTETHGSLSATPQAIVAGATARLTWSTQAPAGCGAIVVKVDGLQQSRTGTMDVSGIDSRTAVLDAHLRRTYKLTAHFGGASRELSSAVVDVYLPIVANRPQVRITANTQAALLKLALQTPNAFVFVENHVALDMTGRTPVYVAEGVHLKGGRTAREPGGLLFMRPAAETCAIPAVCQHPNEVFLDVWDSGQIAGDSVRISGLRISGTYMGSAPDYAHLVFGIQIHSRTNVEIDNNELFGWRGAAVKIEDREDRICNSCPAPNSATIHVHHNYIHHNQHDGGNGYGVDVMHGAYALIEKNVFDYNRHAIAAGGQPGTGYFAYRNLVLENGGFHNSYGPFGAYKAYTHQFDVHGTDHCDEFLWIDGHYNCGGAGEFIDIRYNSFFYTKDSAFKLRGTPSIGADVVSNVFAHSVLSSEIAPGAGALEGYVGQMNVADNLLGIDESGNYGRCDFDGDGLEDLFLATGQTWWFNSGGDRHWRYLNTSKKRLSEVTLGDVDGDRRCDVVADGVVSSGGTGTIRKHPADIVWQGATGQLAVWEMAGGTVTGETRPGLVDLTWRIRSIADFTGDGYRDLLWQDAGGRVSVWEMERGTKLSESYRSRAAETWSVQGAGDFDGDGIGDLLWRDTTGRLAIWFKGEYQPGPSADGSAAPSAYPGYRNPGEPTDLAWTVRGIGDFDGDGRADILWRHTGSALMIWRMIGGLRVGDEYPSAPAGFSWEIQAVADFDGDGRADVLWSDQRGGLAMGFAAAGSAAASAYRYIPGPVDPAWRAADARDFDGDGRADILWQNDLGLLMLWRMAGARVVAEEYLRSPQRGWQLADRVIERTRATSETDVNGELPVERRPSRKLRDGSYEVLGRVSVLDFNRETGWQVPAEKGDTIGGLIFNTLERAPRKGEQVSVTGYRLECTDVSGSRITRVRIVEDPTATYDDE